MEPLARPQLDTEEIGRYLVDQLDQFKSNMQRSKMLVALYNQFAKEYPDSKSILSTDILRAAVVFMHAALEEFLRSLVYSTFPAADTTVLNEIPLSGQNRVGRVEKFLLGDLARFRSLTVAQVLEQSVREYVDRQTYNNRGDLLFVIKSLGLREKDVAKVLPRVEAMLYRRHQIVHRGDKPVPEDQQWIRATSLSPRHVATWIDATTQFVAIALTGAVIKKYIHPSSQKLGRRTVMANRVVGGV